jgi:hypothetical protein
MLRQGIRSCVSTRLAMQKASRLRLGWIARAARPHARRQTLGRGAQPARRADEADVRLPPEHAAVVSGPPQRRYLSERRLRAVAFRGGKGRQDLPTLSARSHSSCNPTECDERPHAPASLDAPQSLNCRSSGCDYQLDWQAVASCRRASTRLGKWDHYCSVSHLEGASPWTSISDKSRLGSESLCSGFFLDIAGLQ